MKIKVEGQFRAAAGEDCKTRPRVSFENEANTFEAFEVPDIYRRARPSTVTVSSGFSGAGFQTSVSTPSAALQRKKNIRCLGSKVCVWSGHDIGVFKPESETPLT